MNNTEIVFLHTDHSLAAAWAEHCPLQCLQLMQSSYCVSGGGFPLTQAMVGLFYSPLFHGSRQHSNLHCLVGKR